MLCGDRLWNKNTENSHPQWTDYLSLFADDTVETVLRTALGTTAEYWKKMQARVMASRASPASARLIKPKATSASPSGARLNLATSSSHNYDTSTKQRFYVVIT